jgi:hypothetical protein
MKRGQSTLLRCSVASITSGNRIRTTFRNLDMTHLPGKQEKPTQTVLEQAELLSELWSVA